MEKLSQLLKDSPEGMSLIPYPYYNHLLQRLDELTNARKLREQAMKLAKELNTT